MENYERQQLKECFENPPLECGPTPFWFLNSDLREEDITHSLEEQCRRKMAGVFMHPRTGMEVEYLSERFWEKLSFCVREAKRLGMKVWLYDEYNWPSGNVGGKLIREHPEYRQRGLNYEIGEAVGGKEFSISFPGEFYAARAVNEKGKAVNLSDKVKENTLRWEPPKGKWKVVVFFIEFMNSQLFCTGNAPWARGEKGYLDLLNRQAVSKFMEYTHAQYERRLGEHFGKTILGIFTDEPGNYKALPWTPSFPEKFKQRYGYDLKEKVHELAFNTGDYRCTRWQYYKLALDLYVDAFFKPISQWAEKRELQFTGHMVFEEDLDIFPNVQVGFFSPMRYLHMPGIDWLDVDTGYDKPTPFFPPGNIAAKQVSSTAHAQGRKRVLCEIFGGDGWATSPEKYKNVINWAQATGINFINPHASHLSLKGLRKRDFPNSHFEQQPWWKHYEKLSEYVSRLSYLNSQGKHVPQVGLLYPMSTLWSEHTLRGKTTIWKMVKETFVSLIDSLLRIHRDYDLLFEESFLEDEIKVEDGFLKLQEEVYPALILPPLTVIPEKVLAKIARFYKEGGAVISIGSLPTVSPEGRETKIRKMLEQIFGSYPEKETWVKNSKGGTAIYYPLSTPLSPGKAEKILSHLLERLLADVKIEGERARDLIYLHREIEGKHFYFFANISSLKVNVRIYLRQRGKVEIWNPQTGKISPAFVYRQDYKCIILQYNFHPHEGIYFVVYPGEEDIFCTDTNIEITNIEDLDSKMLVRGFCREKEPFVQVRRKRRFAKKQKILHSICLPDSWHINITGRNIFLLEPWQINSGSKREIVYITRYVPIKESSQKMIEKAQNMGLPIERLGVYEMMERLREEEKQEDIFPSSGSEYDMSCNIFLSYTPEDIGLVYEDVGEKVYVEVNGKKVREKERPVFLWDRCNRFLPLKDYARKGENQITIYSRMPSFHCQPPSVHGIEPVVIWGSFMVQDGKIVQPNWTVPGKSWTDIGLPYYAGEVTYMQKFNLDPEYISCRLFLEFDRIRECAEVFLNRERVDTLLWSPYRLEITEQVKAGENELEIRVTNTAASLLDKPTPSGIIGRVRIAPYNEHKIEVRRESWPKD